MDLVEISFFTFFCNSSLNLLELASVFLLLCPFPCIGEGVSFSVIEDIDRSVATVVKRGPSENYFWEHL